jgi:hypothetical protein
MHRRCLVPLLLALLAGCGGGSYKVAPVSGRVTLNDQPLANAAVLFQPVTVPGNNGPGPGSTGVTDADGRYTLSITGKDEKGAVVGKHKVRITLMQDSDSTDDEPKKHKRLPAKYYRDTTLEWDVAAAGTDAADFKLAAP